MSQPESRLSRKIMAALRERGAMVWKNHGSQYMTAGLPDIVGVYNGKMIAIETKMPGGRLSEIQKHRLEEMRQAGASVVVAHSVEEALTVIGEDNA